MDDVYIKVNFNGNQSMARFGQPPNLSGKTFIYVNFISIDFRQVIVSDARFIQVSFVDCDF